MKNRYYFRPIDLKNKNHIEMCRCFFEDTMKISQTISDNIDENFLNYIKAVESKQSRDLSFCSLFFADDNIVGCVDAFTLKKKNGVGFISFLYLTPEQRSTGVSHYLERHAMKIFKQHNCHIAFLDVAKCNKRAIGFYKKNSWKIENPIPNERGLIRMKKDLMKI